MAMFSKKMEEAIAEAMALTEPQKASLITDSDKHMGEGDFSKCDDTGCWFCYPQTETETESRNPFAVIADWLRGNLRSEEPSPVEFATGGIVGRGYFYEPDEDEEIIPLSNFVANSAPRAFLINPRTGEQAEIPLQSFELGGWEPIIPDGLINGEIPACVDSFEINSNSFIPRDSLLAKVLMSEANRQSDACEKMDSILRDAPVEKAPLWTHFGRRVIKGDTRIVLYPYAWSKKSKPKAKPMLAFTLAEARTLRDSLDAEINACQE